ncbi:MAG: hypothetical protein V9E93_16580 [Steroidobacteraceae bacterium]
MTGPQPLEHEGVQHEGEPGQDRDGPTGRRGRGTRDATEPGEGVGVLVAAGQQMTGQPWTAPTPATTTIPTTGSQAATPAPTVAREHRHDDPGRHGIDLGGIQAVGALGQVRRGPGRPVQQEQPTRSRPGADDGEPEQCEEGGIAQREGRVPRRAWDPTQGGHADAPGATDTKATVRPDRPARRRRRAGPTTDRTSASAPAPSSRMRGSRPAPGVGTAPTSSRGSRSGPGPRTRTKPDGAPAPETGTTVRKCPVPSETATARGSPGTSDLQGAGAEPAAARHTDRHLLDRRPGSQLGTRRLLAVVTHELDHELPASPP